MFRGKTYRITCKDIPDVEVYGIFEDELYNYTHKINITQTEEIFNFDEFFGNCIKPTYLKKLHDEWKGVFRGPYNQARYFRFFENNIGKKLMKNKPHHFLFSDYYYFSYVYADDEENIKIIENYYNDPYSPIFIADNEFTIALISKNKFEFELMPEPEFKNGAAVDDE